MLRPCNYQGCALKMLGAVLITLYVCLMYMVTRVSSEFFNFAHHNQHENWWWRLWRSYGWKLMMNAADESWWIRFIMKVNDEGWWWECKWWRCIFNYPWCFRHDLAQFKYDVKMYWRHCFLSDYVWNMCWQSMNHTDKAIRICPSLNQSSIWIWISTYSFHLQGMISNSLRCISCCITP